jgi:hypothetical protein
MESRRNSREDQNKSLLHAYTSFINLDTCLKKLGVLPGFNENAST